MTGRFEGSFKALPREIQLKAQVQEARFRVDAHDPRVRTHKLRGALHGLWSMSVDGRHRILFEFTGPDAALFHDIGSHDVYR